EPAKVFGGDYPKCAGRLGGRVCGGGVRSGPDGPDEEDGERDEGGAGKGFELPLHSGGGNAGGKRGPSTSAALPESAAGDDLHDFQPVTRSELAPRKLGGRHSLAVVLDDDAAREQALRDEERFD